MEHSELIKTGETYTIRQRNSKLAGPLIIDLISSPLSMIPVVNEELDKFVS